jgi:hypothetical protein
MLRKTQREGSILSLGLPYRHYLLGKTFPHFAYRHSLRILWTYDVWEPHFSEVEAMVRDAEINILLLSSYHATKHFRRLRIPNCEVHWATEFIDPLLYRAKPWEERKIDVLAFGRQPTSYDDRIRGGCRDLGINYLFQPNFATSQHLADALADTKICVCFPRSFSDPEVAGKVSTLTFRYLEGMASRCLLLGQAPIDAIKRLGYNPVVEVDWKDPLTQLQDLLCGDQEHSALIERNFGEVRERLGVLGFVRRVERLVGRRMRNQRES